jgi:hypothetical protein
LVGDGVDEKVEGARDKFGRMSSGSVASASQSMRESGGEDADSAGDDDDDDEVGGATDDDWVRRNWMTSSNRAVSP